MPLICAYYREAEDFMNRQLLTKFGQLLVKLKSQDEFNAESREADVLLSFFNGMALRPETESRRLCAFNFPVMTVTQADTIAASTA